MATKEGLVAVDTASLGALLEGMDAALREANELVVRLDVRDPAELAAIDYKELKNRKQALSAAYDRTEEARKDFKRKWQEPLNRVEAAFKEETLALRELLEDYKFELTARDDAEKAEKYDRLKAMYLDFCEGNGLTSLVANVPFDRVMDKTWLNKSTSLSKAEHDLIAKCGTILDEWRTLSSAPLNFPDDAQQCYFRTLSLRDALDADRKKTLQQEALDALRNEISDNRAAAGYEPEPEPAPMPMPKPAPAPAPAGPTHTYQLRLTMTEGHFAELCDFIRARGITGGWRIIDGEEAEDGR